MAYERFAAVCALLTAVTVLLYSVSFVIISRGAPATGALLSALFLLLTGLLTIPVFVALYGRLRSVEEGFALLALVLAAAGAVGSAVHGGYDLALAVRPAAGAGGDLPSAVDPRGLLTFGVTGLALAVVSWLILRGGALSRGLGYLGGLLSALLVVIYVARLTIVDATNPLVIGPALAAGFLANPLWYGWLGLTLWRGGAAASARVVTQTETPEGAVPA